MVSTRTTAVVIEIALPVEHQTVAGVMVYRAETY